MSRSPSFSLKSETDLKVDEKVLQQWVCAFCIIRFDLEQGQLVEECFPPGCLTQNEELEIAFSSFPDSATQNHNRSSIHDCIFFFRIRREEIGRGTTMASHEDIAKRNASWVDRIIRQRSFGQNEPHKYLYGFVFNRQRHDNRLKRGGEQKSVVILSHIPYSSLFRPLLQIVGPLYFDIGKKALTYIAASMSTWPAPVPGQLMELPVGPGTLKVNLPPAHSLPLDSGMYIEDSASPVAPFLPSNQSVPQGLFHDSDLFGTFRSLLVHLWKLWEMVLIGEPILIIAPTPSQCCEAVAGLVSLIAPLLCSVDYRPYFTIHDPEFSLLNSLPQGATFPPMFLGVTNLFFLKALRNFPHVISVGIPGVNSSRLNPFSRASVGGVSDGQEGSGLQNSLKKLNPSNFLNAVKRRRDGPLCLMSEHREAIWSTYSAITKPDTSILNRLIDAGLSPRVEESMSLVNNEILRRHFLELMTNFLAPFGPYFRVTTPSEGSSPFVDPPSLPPFNVEEFLSTLSARGPGKFLQKRMKANWLELYRRFMGGPNFWPWFQRKCIAAEVEQARLWRQARMKTDIHKFTSEMSELEIVDSFNRIERYLLEELQSGNADADIEATSQKLKQDLQALFTMMPKDMQELILMNPQKASLLQGIKERTKLAVQPVTQNGVLAPHSPR